MAADVIKATYNLFSLVTNDTVTPDSVIASAGDVNELTDTVMQFARELASQETEPLINWDKLVTLVHIWSATIYPDIATKIEPPTCR